MLEFIKVTEQDDMYHYSIYNILEKCGQYMYENDNLTHWLKPYSLKNIKDDTKTKEVFIVKENENIIATFSLSDIKTRFFNDDKKYIYISKFAVLPNNSRSGIGMKCIKYIDGLVIEKNFLGLRLDVYEKSEKAIRFYMKNGFENLFMAETRNFRVVCMEKRMR